MRDNPGSNSLYQSVMSGFFATLSYLIGGIDNLFIAFVLFMGLDFFTGALAGAVNYQLSSDRAFRGLAKKCGMFCFAIVANQLDINFGAGNGFLRGAVLMILIGTEGISIMENLAKMGIKIPKVLYDRLEQLQGGNKDPNDTSKEDPFINLEKEEEKKDV